MRPPTCPLRPGIAVAAAAASIGATDLFVFRRITADRFVHVGGLGRGEGWAGNIDLILAAEDLAREAMTTGVPVFARAAEPVHVFGPYYQRDAVFVPLPPDVLVVVRRRGRRARSPSTEPRSPPRPRPQPPRSSRSRPRSGSPTSSSSSTRCTASPRRTRCASATSCGTSSESAIEALSCDLGVIYVAELDVIETAAARAVASREAGLVPPRHAGAPRGSGRATRLHPGLRDRAAAVPAQRLRRDLALRSPDRRRRRSACSRSCTPPAARAGSPRSAARSAFGSPSRPSRCSARR